VRLQPETALPTGSTITFQLLQTTPPTLSSLTFNLAQGQPVSTRPAPLLELAQGWSSLQQIFSLLSGRSGLLGSETPLNLPSITTGNAPAAPNAAPKDIGSGLLFFISTLRGGKFREWLGKDTITWLENQNQGNLVKKTEAEFNAIANLYAEAKPGHWQTLIFPVIVDGTPQQVRAFVKRDRQQNNKNQPEDKTEDTRFIVEIDLTTLGELQLDGFVRKQSSETSFDLMIRSLQPLDSNIQNDIMGIYNATGAVTGYKGSLAFQSVKEFPVNPMEELMANHNIITA